MKKQLFTVAFLGLSGSLTGCATITTNSMQPIAVTTKDLKGTDVQQVACTLKNEKGQWSVSAPNIVNVHKASGNLNVECKKPGYPDGKLTAISRAGMGMAGNIIIGGVIGAVVDHSSGKAYNYPENLPVVMGKAVSVDRRKQDNKVTNNKDKVEKNHGISTDG